MADGGEEWDNGLHVKSTVISAEQFHYHVHQHLLVAGLM